MARPAPRRQLIFQDSALLDPARQAALLDQAKRQGFTGLQQDVAWGNVRAVGRYDPAKIQALKSLFAAANARGLHPQVRLMGSSSTMQTSNPGIDMALNTQHPNAHLMRQFAFDMARNFGGQVSKYSVWNEPNIGPGRSSWGSPKQAARTARELYQQGRAGVKSANHAAKVGFGELVGDPAGTEHGAMSQLGFMRQVLALGNKPLTADFVSVHPYQLGNPSKVSRRQVEANPDFAGVSYLQNAQHAISRAFAQGRLRTGTGKRPDLTIGEFGYKHNWVPNAATRAAYIRRSLELARQAGVNSVNLYQFVPNLHPGSSWDSSIADPRGQLSPAMRAALRRFR